MDASIPVFSKPCPQLSVLDWTRNIQKLQNEARIRRFESYELRQRGNQLRNETSITTKWDTYVNNELLRDRIFEVESWREKQRFTREQVRDESRALREEKNATELQLESLQVPLMVTAQCLSNRDQRLPPELTRDTLGEELNKELHIIENNKRVLSDVCNMGWEKLKDLTNVFCRLEREIQNKDDALLIDRHVKELDRFSSNISYKLNPTRIPPESMTEESYVHCIENTIKIAEQLMRESKTLRETMFKSREQTRNQLYEQCQAVELVMRRRVFDVQRARNEMEWQKQKLEQNLVKLDREIEALRAAVADKVNPTKLVETRLEERTRRPALERVQVKHSQMDGHPELDIVGSSSQRFRKQLRDANSINQDKPMRGLVEEYGRVHTSTNLLEKKLEDALSTYHGMFNHYQRATKDLQYKNQALETDRRLVEVRKPLHRPDDTEFRRNVGYCHLRDELVTD